ncbi:MAG: UDP-N-acetylmuramoyl-L-alanyl-D-glutamate--2,6-diaminopimelate ligase [Phycisphaerae bacterium]|nr:UDP-N-acetylmuramoyl-L-alanyl-D-glutamate--2,6-diaminopimelate ligase [Phycisphaerae bacterium]
MDVVGLRTALRGICGNIGDLSLSGRVCADSRVVRPGDVFVACRGGQVNGHDYIDAAVAQGASFIVAERPVQQDIDSAVVANSSVVMGELAHAAQGYPGRGMTVLGVTGTNGKTTVAYLAQAMLQAGGYRCGLIGTVGHDLGNGEVVKANNTTPNALELASMMKEMRDNELNAMVMECSSHGLDQFRVSGISFDAAAFTNLTGDHIDYHGNIVNYRSAKSKLFWGLKRGATAVLNAQDPASEFMSEVTIARVCWYGMDGEADIKAVVKSMGFNGCELALNVMGKKLDVRLNLIGEHNVSNCLAAIGLAWAAGVSIEDIGKGVEGINGVPGRLEPMASDRDFTVLVDYAHTDDGLKHALTTIKALAVGRVIVVFGCGGDRDRSKRPRMAQVAQAVADLVVVTNDNPRTEDPEQIFSDIREGFSNERNVEIQEIADRREAIAHAMGRARRGDVVLVAGKGHEDYQLVGGEVLAFDDRAEIRKLLNP